MNDSSVAAAYLSGVEAGRFQGHEAGRDSGYRDGYQDGLLEGGILAWRAAEADERARFATTPPAGTSYAELTRIRNATPSKPLKTPAECLATWSTP